MSGPRLRFDHKKIDDQPLRRTRCIIGRNKDCTIRIPHEGISGRHAEIFRQEGQWWIRDLQSTNGTHVDGNPVVDLLPLSDGCRLLLGRLHATFAISATATSPKSTGRGQPSASPAKSRAESKASNLAPPQEQTPRAKATAEPRRRPMRLNPMWAAVAIVVCGIVTFLVLKNRTPTPDRPDVAVETPDPNAAITEKVAVVDTTESLSEADDNPEDDLNAFHDGTSDDNSEVPDYESTTHRDHKPKKPRRDTKPPTPSTNTPGASSATTSLAGEKVGATKKPSKPTVDPLDLALARGNALEIAKLVRRAKSPRAIEVRRRLASERIFCLHRSGRLGSGDSQLLSAFGFHCAPDQVKKITKLVPGCRIEEWKLKVRYFQDYSKGLGRRVGKRRMAPHPKTVAIELSALSGRTHPYTAELLTPSAGDLSDDGLTEEQVWAMTLEDLAARIQAFL